MFTMFKDKRSREWREQSTPELTQAMAELFTMAFRVNNETDFSDGREPQDGHGRVAGDP